MSKLSRKYEHAYRAISGRHPTPRPWHHQWLAGRDLYKDLRRILPAATGLVLDVGCGDKPYRRWAPNAGEWFGVDIFAGPDVDQVLDPGLPWNLESCSFDSIVCTQVLEHVRDLPLVVREIHRTLRPGGLLIITVPFAYNEHGSPHDYRRLSQHGVRALFEQEFDIEELHVQGRVGTLLGIITLNWTDCALNRNRITRIARGPLLPLWVLFAGAVNLLAVALDGLDQTGVFYHNVIMVARKRPQSADLDGVDTVNS